MNDIESCNIVLYASFTHISHVVVIHVNIFVLFIYSILFVCVQIYIYMYLRTCIFIFGYHLSRCIKLSRIDVEDESSTGQVLAGVLMIFVSVRTGIHQFFYKALCLEGVGIGVVS